MARDELFKQSCTPGRFQFNEPVAEVFDDMLKRSVPYYHQVIAMSVHLLADRLVSGDTIYDLGCSTGTTLLELSRQLQEMDLEFIGLDNSEAMIAKARKKAAGHEGCGRLSFRKQDILDVKMSGAGAVVLNYTLQFLAPQVRGNFLQKTYSGLRPGGMVLVSEKITAETPVMNSMFTALYHEYKKEQGYSQMEIAQKREALEDVLIPLTIEENKNMLLNAGFAEVETFFQWFNFASFVAIKG